MPLTVVIGPVWVGRKGESCLVRARQRRQLRSFELVAPIPGTPGQIATAEVSFPAAARRVPR